MKLLEGNESKINKNENGENVPHLEFTKVVLIHCNIINNDYQQDSRALYTFVTNESFGQLLEISTKNFIPLKTFNSEFSYIEVWFTGQNFKPLEIEDKINITFVLIGRNVLVILSNLPQMRLKCLESKKEKKNSISNC